MDNGSLTSNKTIRNILVLHMTRQDGVLNMDTNV